MRPEGRTADSIKWRGGQVTRLEALTDAVFGFAITLLVVSLEVPQTFDDLMGMMRGFVAFAGSFTLLILVWSYHYKLFARYDLEDAWTIVLNSVLLFVVLFYVYPLKFVSYILLGGGMERAFDSWDQVALVMAIYGVGFIAVFVVFGLLYMHAYRLRERLGLTPKEAHYARAKVADCTVMVCAGVLSVALALFTPGRAAAPISGFSYFLIGPAQWYVGVRMHRLAPPDTTDDAAPAAGAASADAANATSAASPVEPAAPMPPIHTS